MRPLTALALVAAVLVPSRLHADETGGAALLAAAAQGAGMQVLGVRGAGPRAPEAPARGGAGAGEEAPDMSDVPAEWKNVKEGSGCYDSDGLLAVINPVNLPAQVGVAGRTLYAGAALEMRRRNRLDGTRPARGLNGREKVALRPIFGGLVDQVRVTYNALLMYDIPIDFTDPITGRGVRLKTYTIPNEIHGQTFGTEIYIKDPDPGTRMTEVDLQLLVHEMQHFRQYSLLGRSTLRFGFHYFYNWAWKGFDYRENCMEAEAYGVQGLVWECCWKRYRAQSVIEAPVASKQLLEKLYQGILGRGIDPGSKFVRLRELEEGGAQRVAASMVQSEEFRQRSIVGLYRSMLGRDPDAGGLENARNFLSDGHSLEQLRWGILQSPEYFEKQSGSDVVTFVKRAYLDTLGREPSREEAAGWIRRMEGGESRREVARRIVFSPEATSTRVKEAYRTYLHREAEPGGLDQATRFLAGGGTPEDLIVRLVSSPEFVRPR